MHSVPETSLPSLKSQMKNSCQTCCQGSQRGFLCPHQEVFFIPKAARLPKDCAVHSILRSLSFSFNTEKFGTPHTLFYLFALLQTRYSLWDIHGQYAKDTTSALPGQSHWAQLRDRLSNWAPWDLPFILTKGTQGAQNRMSAERPCPEELGRHCRPLWCHKEFCYSFLSQHFAVFTCSGELGQLMSPFPSPGTFSA